VNVLDLSSPISEKNFRRRGSGRESIRAEGLKVNLASSLAHSSSPSTLSFSPRGDQRFSRCLVIHEGITSGLAMKDAKKGDDNAF
jgi:hypothetical protein